MSERETITIRILIPSFIFTLYSNLLNPIFHLLYSRSPLASRSPFSCRLFCIYMWSSIKLELHESVKIRTTSHTLTLNIARFFVVARLAIWHDLSLPFVFFCSFRCCRHHKRKLQNSRLCNNKAKPHKYIKFLYFLKWSFMFLSNDY